MKVLLSGATGLIGTAFQGAARPRFEIESLRRASSGSGAWWNPETGEINSDYLDSWRPDAFVHLAGENIASRRWSRRQKRRIEESRVGSTERLIESLLALKHPPGTFISASATGYYGDRGDEILTEESPSGRDFLAGVVLGWERAAGPLRTHGVRVVHLRFGVVLSTQGGALARMTPLFNLGLGGRLGSGKQWMSWVALEDAVTAVAWALDNDRATGAYNVVSPNPVTNAQFTRELARTLHRPSFLAVPAGVLRAAFGELAQALLLSSQRAIPRRLLEEGYKFRTPELANALDPQLC